MFFWRCAPTKTQGFYKAPKECSVFNFIGDQQLDLADVPFSTDVEKGTCFVHFTKRPFMSCVYKKSAIGFEFQRQTIQWFQSRWHDPLKVSTKVVYVEPFPKRHLGVPVPFTLKPLCICIYRLRSNPFWALTPHHTPRQWHGIGRFR